MSSIPSPLGTLSVFPREIRDGIYGYLIGMDSVYRYYLQMKPYTSKKWLPSPAIGRNPPTFFPILQLSKCIRREALTCLTTQSMFEFDFRSQSPSPSDIPFLDHLLHITYAATMNPKFADYDPSLKLSAGPLQLFAGAKIPQNICIVRLSDCTPDIGFHMDSPLFSAVSRLTGFKEVRMILYTLSWYSDEGSDRPGFQPSMDVDQMVNMMTSLLEPFLGSCSVGHEDRGKWKEWQWVLTFHPQDHLSRKG